MKKIKFFIFSFAISFSQAQESISLDSIVNSFVVDNAIYNAHVGLSLFDVDQNKPLVEYHSKKLFLPASIQKLFTTATALELLPLDFTFETKIFYSGELNQASGYVNGNLFIKCSGDPSLESRYFPNKSFLKELKEQLALRGIKGFEGDLILINQKDDFHQVNSNWLWGDIGNYYGAGVSNFSFRDNFIEVFFNSFDSVGKLTGISKIIPTIDNLKIINEVVGGLSSKDLAYAYGGPNHSTRKIIGEIPTGKKDFSVKISMPNPKEFLIYEITQLIDFKNKLVQDSSMKNLFNYSSPKLVELLKVINNRSNNNYTEHVLLAAMGGLDSIKYIDLGPVYMKGYWKEKLMINDQFYLVDGCGLSRKNALSPEIVNKLLLYLNNNERVKEEFVSTLAVAGVSGTLKYLGKGSAYEGQFKGKSGSMDGVRCYAGYFYKNNKTYAFTIMINNFTCSAKKTKDIISKLMNSLYMKL